MANEYKLSYTATEIDEKLGTIESLEESINTIETDINTLEQKTVIVYKDAMVDGCPKDESYLITPDGDYLEHVNINYFNREEFLTSEGNVQIAPFYAYYPIIDTTNNVIIPNGYYILKTISSYTGVFHQYFEGMESGIFGKTQGKKLYVRYGTGASNMSELSDISYALNSDFISLQSDVDSLSEEIANFESVGGKSAYEIALANGFEGTEQEWLDSLKGADGKDGYTPVKGTDYWTSEDKEEIVEVIKNELQESTDYTNVLKSALDADGVSVYNDTGYKADTRWSSSGNSESTSAGTYLTGYIPVTKNDIIRLKNITMPNQNSNACMIHKFNNDFSKATGNINNAVLNTDMNPVWDSNNNLLQFSISGDMSHIRIQCGGIDETSIITINEEIPEDTVEVKIENINKELSSINSRIDEIENSNGDNVVSNNIPDYWLEELNNGVKEINIAMSDAGRNKSAFLFYSDIHWTSNTKMSPMLLKYLYENTAMVKTFFGGDAIDAEGESTDTEDTIPYDTMQYLWQWRNAIKDLPNHHSVVGNHDDGNHPNDKFSEEYVYNFLLAAEEDESVVYGDDGLYYYIDNNAEKTRYLFLDTGYKGASVLGDSQTLFIKNALKTTSDGWHIVVIAHIWRGVDYDQYNLRPIPLVDGYVGGAAALVPILDQYNTRTGEFADCSAKVEFCIGGHTHYDNVSFTPSGIPVIIVETDSTHTRGEFTHATGTTSESSINGVIADYNSNIISIVRVGRGDSFVIDLNNSTPIHTITNHLANVTSSSNITKVASGESFSTILTATSGSITSVTITMDGVDITASVYNEDTGEVNISNATGNIVITAVAPAYINILDTVGYTNNKRFGSDGTERDNIGSSITGFIPTKAGDYIYLKNITMQVDDSNYGNGLFYYDNDKTKIQGYYLSSDKTNIYQADSSNNITRIFVDDFETDTAYVRLSVASIDDDSIITVNQPID